MKSPRFLYILIENIFPDITMLTMRKKSFCLKSGHIVMTSVLALSENK